MAKSSSMPFRPEGRHRKFKVKRRSAKDVQRSVVLQGLKHLGAPAVLWSNNLIFILVFVKHLWGDLFLGFLVPKKEGKGHPKFPGSCDVGELGLWGAWP